MSITDELREYATTNFYVGSPIQLKLRLIANHIDAAQKELSERYMELPKDADGEYIHIDDDVEWRHTCGDNELRHGIVTGIKTDNVDGELFHEVAINADGFTVRLMASELRHHHSLTVEDVLRGVVTLCHNIWKKESPFHFCEVDDVMKSGNIADFAAKLQLKEEA